MPQEYDVQQVCENGHQITGGFHTWPDERKKFCQECGEPTITSCPECGADIQGAKMRHIMTVSDFGVSHHRKALEDIVSVPSYCSNCGAPYPWTRKRIQAAIQMFAEFGKLEDKENETIEQDVENIAKDVPETELSAMRIKRIWEKYGPIAYNVIMELTSRTAAHTLKNP